MLFWIVSVLILFSSIQFFQWIKDIISPLPIYILSGSFLAITSNYDDAISATFSSLRADKKIINSDKIIAKE